MATMRCMGIRMQHNRWTLLLQRMQHFVRPVGRTPTLTRARAWCWAQTSGRAPTAWHWRWQLASMRSRCGAPTLSMPAGS